VPALAKYNHILGFAARMHRVFHACLQVGDKILGFDLSLGGHLNSWVSGNFSGRLYNPVFYGVEKETGVFKL